jgi:hypothetical protein
VSLHTPGNVGILGFHSAQFSSCAASSLRCRGCCRSLNGESIALYLSLSSRNREESGCVAHCLSRGDAGRLSFFGVSDGGGAAPGYLNSFLFNSPGILGHNSHVTFSAFDLMRKSGRRYFTRHCLSLFAPDGFIQKHYGIFQSNQTRARLPG